MKRIIPFLTALSIALASSGCSSAPSSESLSTTGIYFDTVVQIEVWGADQDIIDHCEEMCEYYEQLLSITVEDSEISAINRAWRLN